MHITLHIYRVQSMEYILGCTCILIVISVLFRLMYRYLCFWVSFMYLRIEGDAFFCVLGILWKELRPILKLSVNQLFIDVIIRRQKTNASLETPACRLRSLFLICEWLCQRMIALFIFGGYSYLCFAKTVPCKAKAIVGYSIANTINAIFIAVP